MRPQDFLSAQEELTEQETSLLCWTDTLQGLFAHKFRIDVSTKKKHMTDIKLRKEQRELELLDFVNRAQSDPFHGLKLAEISKQLTLLCFDYIMNIRGTELLYFTLFKDAQARQEKCPNLIQAMEQFQKVGSLFISRCSFHR